MAVKQIPKKLLPHVVEWQSYIGESNWSGEQYADPITIYHVRVDDIDSLRLGSKYDKESSSILFIDAVNSTPFPSIKSKDRVKFGEDTMIVTKVNTLYEFNKLHHLEVELK